MQQAPPSSLQRPLPAKAYGSGLSLTLRFGSPKLVLATNQVCLWPTTIWSTFWCFCLFFAPFLVHSLQSVKYGSRRWPCESNVLHIAWGFCKAYLLLEVQPDMGNVTYIEGQALVISGKPAVSFHLLGQCKLRFRGGRSHDRSLVFHLFTRIGDSEHLWLVR